MCIHVFSYSSLLSNFHYLIIEVLEPFLGIRPTLVARARRTGLLQMGAKLPRSTQHHHLQRSEAESERVHVLLHILPTQRANRHQAGNREQIHQVYLRTLQRWDALRRETSNQLAEPLRFGLSVSGTRLRPRKRTRDHKKMLKRLEPKKIYPIHTEYPQHLKGKFSQTQHIETCKTYTL